MRQHRANLHRPIQNETFHSSSLATNALTEDQIKSLVTYWFKTGKATTRDWYMQVDFHGGATSAISALADDATSYSHRDKLFLFNFYDRVDSGKTFPANGLDFIGGWVNEITTGMKPDEWGMYINYPDPTMDQDTAQKLYWGKHLPRLQKLKAVYDPEELFFYPQSVRPAKE